MNQENSIYTNDYKNLNKKRIFLILSILIVLLIIGMIILIKNYMNTETTFKYNWGITLPKDFKEEYHIETDQAFGGDGEGYSIYSGTKFSFNYDDSNIELEQKIEELNTTLNIPYDKELNKYYFYEIFL